MATTVNMTELEEITQNTADNGDQVGNISSEATERDPFLNQNNGSNGQVMDPDRGTKGETNREKEKCTVSRVKDQLMEKVFWKIRLWMVLIFLLVVIVSVIFISLALCTALHVDEDEQFDPSLFTIPHYFNGSFRMSNSTSTPSQVSVLEGKLADLYRSSPALGRYFSKAVLNDFRDGSVVIQYNLTFVLPEEQQEELRNFTLSRGMVYNVFRQFLYDQDPTELGALYIDPVSLAMSSVH